MKYTVALTAHAGIVVEVDAVSAEEARTKAENDAYVSLCHQCSHQVSVGDDWEATEVLDDEGHTAWNEAGDDEEPCERCGRVETCNCNIPYPA